MDEAPAHPHNVARGTFATVGGVVQPMPAPRYGDSVEQPRRLRREGEDGAAILAELGYSTIEIEELLS
jgi:alpha-methylacyl-CoA racemase